MATEYFFTLLISGTASFFAHHFSEKFFTKNGKKKVKLILKGYQIHHSAWGLLAIIGALISTGLYATAMFGYGIGNIWQHKRSHNKANENGLVFITKHFKDQPKNPTALT